MTASTPIELNVKVGAAVRFAGARRDPDISAAIRKSSPTRIRPVLYDHHLAFPGRGSDEGGRKILFAQRSVRPPLPVRQATSALTQAWSCSIHSPDDKSRENQGLWDLRLRRRARVLCGTPESVEGPLGCGGLLSGKFFRSWKCQEGTPHSYCSCDFSTGDLSHGRPDTRCLAWRPRAMGSISLGSGPNGRQERRGVPGGALGEPFARFNFTAGVASSAKTQVRANDESSTKFMVSLR